MANVLCLDFDDTIVLDNTFAQLMDRFVAPAAYEERVLRPKRAGLSSVEQQNAAGLDLIDPSVTRAEIEAFVRSVAVPRPGLLELLDWAHWNGWQVAVVSLGLDVYVDPVLDDLGIDRVVRHTGRTTNAYRWRVRYLSPRGIEVQSGFKVSYANAFRDSGDFVAYAGDGASDVEPASIAGAVFARSTLLDRLRGRREHVFPFETFHDVVSVLEREARGWPRRG